MRLLRSRTRLTLRAGVYTALYLSAAWMLAGCASASTSAPTATPAPPRILRVAGSGGATTVFKFLAETYQVTHPEIRFQYLEGTGSSGAVTGVLEGVLDLGTMSRAPKEAETGKGIGYLLFASDRVVIATSPDLAVSGLTSRQVKDIFLGRITNWSEVGGPDAAIGVLVREEEESSTQVLRKNLFGDEPFPANTVVFTSEGDLRKALAGMRNGIAFLSYGGMRLTDTDVHALTIDGIDPADILSAYPYFRPLGVAYLPDSLPVLQAFLDLLSGPDAHDLLAGKGINHPD